MAASPSASNDPALRGAWLAALLALGVYLYRNGLVVWPYLFSTGGDFANYHRAAAAVLQGESPFTRAAFDYPPLVALLMLPLASLPLDAARVAWFLASHLCLLGAAVLLWRPLGRDRAALLALAALWALAGTVQENLALGQIQPLLLLLLAFAFREDSTHPGRSAAALGLAAGLKVWPGLLLFADLEPRRLRALLLGLGIAALAVALPLLTLLTCCAPPHLPTSADYWMGTPAALNFSLPALAVRLTYPVSADSPPPVDWQAGNNPEGFHLAPWRRGLSVAVSLATLAAGLLAIFRVYRRRDRLYVLAALVALATLASPISWYHYQVFQLPGLALLGAAYLRRRAWWPLAGLAVLAVGLTREEVRNFLWGSGETANVLATGAVVVALNVLLIVLLLREVWHSHPLAASVGQWYFPTEGER